VLRIHFSTEDLGRIRVAESPDPLWEVVLSLHQWQHRRPDPDLAGWQRHAHRVVRSSDQFAVITRLLALVPSHGYTPDFLTPTGCATLEEGLDAILRTPGRRVRGDLDALAEGVRPPLWVRDLAEGGSRQLAVVVAALRRYHDLVVGPRLADVGSPVAADDVRTRAVARHEADAVLARLAPGVQWREPVLQAPYPRDQDLYLRGRGLLLVPSHFCRRTPVTLADPDLEPVLVFPTLTVDREPSPDLVALLGRTRAGVVQALATPRSTSEIGRVLNVSVASASEHATTLRNAGLVSSTRRGNVVLHVLTSKGYALLSAT
jgi:DNA-binding transcriptional ArsR family regulator